MPETQPPPTHICSGCARHFTKPTDLAPARVGRDEHRYCRQCYTSALGIGHPIPFEKAAELVR